MGSSQSSNKSNNQTKNMAIDEEYYDRVVCKNEDINEGQFKEIKLDNTYFRKINLRNPAFAGLDGK